LWEAGSFTATEFDVVRLLGPLGHRAGGATRPSDLCYKCEMVTFPRLCTAAMATSLTILAVVPIIAHPCAAQGRAERDRLALEARGLFQALERNPTDIERCAFEREWDGRPVVAETAQRYLKLALRADLVVSDPPASIMQVIDPDGTRPEHFCRAEERRQVRRDALAAFETKGGTVLRFVSIGYSFPVFNADYTRAALVVQRQVDSYLRMPDGTFKSSLEAAGGAEIYEKRNGIWNQIAYDSYYTAH
jgi:hypothetical protein